MLLGATLLSSMLCTSVSAVTMYAADGRTADVMDVDVPAWKAVGWYDVPVVTMYALDGRTSVVATSDVDAWRAVGWYDVPVTTVYAPDGRTAVIATSDVEAWKAVGWFDKNYITMYAADGRTSDVLLADVPAWKAVGWYDVPVTTVYAPDGRAAVIATYDVEAWKAVGWHEYPSAFVEFVQGYGNDLQTLRNSYSGLTDMGWLGTNYGLEWYHLTNKIKIGFEGVNVTDYEHNYDSGGRCVAVFLPIWEAYPALYEAGGDDQILTKQEFENFVGVTFELNSSYYSIYSSPYLSYKQNGYEIVVLCDENGNINVSHYERDYCFMYKR